MSSTETEKLFQPFDVGRLRLNHRVVHAPLTRSRSCPDHVPSSMMKDYYTQRASSPGTLLITEATYIAAEAGGLPFNIPGIWTTKQIMAWREITQSVHQKDTHIFLQLWAMGRAAFPAVLHQESLPYVSASDVPLTTSVNRPAELNEPPQPLTTEEIRTYVELYAQAAKNAIEKAGFDGVEIHGANGYLIDQFLQNASNKRTDEYGGSKENRARFALEIVGAVVRAVGADRTAIRISPWSPYNDMKMTRLEATATFTHLVTEIKKSYPDFAYLHVIEPYVAADTDVGGSEDESNNFLRELWQPNPMISGGRYSRATAVARAEARHNEAIAFGRLFLANPDLPERLKAGPNVKLNKPDKDTFYFFGRDVSKEGCEVGYTDYPFATKEELGAQASEPVAEG